MKTLITLAEIINAIVGITGSFVLLAATAFLHLPETHPIAVAAGLAAIFSVILAMPLWAICRANDLREGGL